MPAVTGITSCDAHAVRFARRAARFALTYGLGADDPDAMKRFGRIATMSGEAMFQPIAGPSSTDRRMADIVAPYKI